MTRENVIVDFFLAKAPLRVKSALDAIGCLMYGIIICILVWRTAIGGAEVRAHGDVTIILAWPIWITFPIGVFCLAVLACVTIYTLAISTREVQLNHEIN